MGRALALSMGGAGEPQPEPEGAAAGIPDSTPTKKKKKKRWSTKKKTQNGMLASVATSLARRLRAEPELLMLMHTAVGNLKPASNVLTDKGEQGLLAQRHGNLFASTEWLLPSTVLPNKPCRICRTLGHDRTSCPQLSRLGHQSTDPGVASGNSAASGSSAAAGNRSAAGSGTGVWFLKKVQTSLTRGVTCHSSRADAIAAAESESTVEFVLQAAVERPWLYYGRKCHFRLYLLAVSAPASTGAPHWYASKHVWIAAAPDLFDATSTERGVQLSARRTAHLDEYEDEEEAAAIWSVLHRWGQQFVGQVASGGTIAADSGGGGATPLALMHASRLSDKQRQYPAYQLFGVDLVISTEEEGGNSRVGGLEGGRVLALEMNFGPMMTESEAPMQERMMEIVLGDRMQNSQSDAAQSQSRRRAEPEPRPNDAAWSTATKTSSRSTWLALG